MDDFKKFTFSPVDVSHQSLILQWLDKDHVKEWFHGEGLKSTLEGLKKFVEKDNPSSDLWIGYYQGEPFAYLITSDVLDAQANDPDCPLRQWIEPGKKMITLDLLIGEEKFLGKGLATNLVKTFIFSQFSDADIVFIDPERSNTKAIHVYEKVGFEKVGEFIASWHPVPHCLMRLNRI